MESVPQIHFFLFVNSVSGGGVGHKYLTVKNRRLKFRSAKDRTFIYIFDLFSESQRSKGFKQALQATQQQPINIIICGGDGTVSWVLEEVIKFQINPNKVNFGIIPIGTGNDFSRTLNWGGDSIDFKQGDLDELKQRIIMWKNATVKKYDIWNIQLITYQGGKILMPRQQEQSKGSSEYTRIFSNYVGIGIDARTSYAFEKNRTQSKLLNIVVYGCLGCCNYFKKAQKLNDAITQLSQTESDNENSSNDSTDHEINVETKNDLLTQSGKKKLKLGKKQRGIVILNSTSYMAGVKNIWKNKNTEEYFSQQIDDGKLQFVSFRNQMSLLFQRFLNVGTRVGQGSGPFIFQFSNDIHRQLHIQIDGESMVTYGLKQILISKSDKFPNSQISTLYNSLQ